MLDVVRWGPDLRRARLAVALLAALLLVGAGCGGGEEQGQQTLRVRVAHTSTLDPGGLSAQVGPLEFGKEFGLDISQDDIKYFAGHPLAMQVLLSGRADVVGGSFVSDLQLIERGVPLRVFCPSSTGFASRIVGTGNITELQQITDPDTRVAIESPGGPVNFFMDLVLRAKGIDITTLKLPNVSVIEDAPLREAALANGDVDVALIDAYQVPLLEKAIGAKNVHILSDVMKDAGSGGIFLAFAATKKWLDDNQKSAAAFCASILKSNRELAGDFAKYQETANKYIKPKVDEPTLRSTWEEARQYQLWPYNEDLAQDGVNLVVQTAVDTGLLKTKLRYEDIVDTRPMERALELLGGPVDPDTITASLGADD